MKVVAAVFARGGSAGVPDKNLRTLGGRTLVARAVSDAAACSGVDRVIVSTDSERIAEEGERAGAEVPWLRPAELSTGTAREWHAWQHLLRWLDDRGELPDRLLVVPCTAPLRALEDLERCIEASRDPDIDVVLTVTAARRNPWFNMVRLDADGNVRLVNEPSERIHRRQDAPSVHDVATVAFVARPSYVLSATSLYDGTVRAVQVPEERGVDIDTETDLAFAEFLLARRGGRG